MARLVRSSSAWQARRYKSVPKRSQISMTRFSPVRLPAMMAMRSL